jgi:hypothetical protein
MCSVNYSINSFSMDPTFRMDNNPKMQRMSENEKESILENAKRIIPSRESPSSLIGNMEMWKREYVSC